MKTIYYSLIACIICIVLASSSLKTSKSVTLQAVQANSSGEALTQSANIISSRLKIFGIVSSAVIVPERNQIEVRIPENTNLTEIEPLLTSEGNVAFYETVTLKEIADLNGKSGYDNSSDARLDCFTSENIHYSDSIDNVLISLGLPDRYKLAWGTKNSMSMTCLYVLKLSDSGKPALSGSDIESVNSAGDKISQSLMIEIKFKSAASEVWSVTTGKSIGKPIAIVIDGKVFYTPVVRDRIESGLCEISGNFSQSDVNYFVALVSSKPLPVKFMLK